ncbi:MAG: FecR domain-containing protein [Candidatus Marinarcus sp.]|uniref:FecR domain-containing protein n=1 Tax=Candidatus Marinarcus sp. TaxID=3100987 RepID=UPI003AFFC936
MKKILILLTLFSVFLFANVAKVVAFKGDAFIIRDNKEIKLELGSIILKNDAIKTQDNTKVQIIFTDNTIITVGKNSQLNVNNYIYDEQNKEYNANFGLLKGTFRTITGKIGKIAPNKFKLSSKTSSIGIRGTQILSNIQISGDTIFCTEGQIDIVSKTTGETVTLTAGEFIQIKEGSPLGEVQKFDQKSIAAPDSETKFVPEEEKEAVLDNFKVNIIESTPEPNSNPMPEANSDPKVPAPVDAEPDPDPDPTPDPDPDPTPDPDPVTPTPDPAPVTPDPVTLIGSTAMYDATEDLLNFPMLGTLDDEKIALDDHAGTIINVKMDDLTTKYSTDGSYSGNLSSSGNQSFPYRPDLLFVSGTYTSVADSPTGFDKTDDIQWGTWNATFSYTNPSNQTDTFDLNGISYWLAGEQTSEAEVTALMMSSTTEVTYNGYALGRYDNYTATFDATNSNVTLKINFGASTVGGSFAFILGGNTVTLKITSEGIANAVTSSGFSFKGEEGGSGNGKFYGPNASSAGGNFNLNGPESTSFVGVFKAKK